MKNVGGAKVCETAPAVAWVAVTGFDLVEEAGPVGDFVPKSEADLFQSDGSIGGNEGVSRGVLRLGGPSHTDLT